MKRRRKFSGVVLMHLYQRLVSRGLIFYSVKDLLVFYTIFCIYAERHKVRILGLCLMFDHIHVLVETDSQAELSAFVRDYTSSFSLEYNRHYGLKGQLFERCGMAVKTSDKAKRTAVAYVYNNPVEARLCKTAEQWQWDFLAYARSANPFSKPAALRNTSPKLRRAIAFVTSEHIHERFLTYACLDRIFDRLAPEESKQLTDCIVSTYSVIDFAACSCLYGSFDGMLLAFRSNTGSEYEIKEERERRSDSIYIKMTNFVSQERGLRNIGDLLRMPPEEKAAYADTLIANCGANVHQLRKFLHLPARRD